MVELTVVKENKNLLLDSERIILKSDDKYNYTLAYIADNGRTRAVYKRIFPKRTAYYIKWVNPKNGKIDYSMNQYFSENDTKKIIEFIEEVR